MFNYEDIGWVFIYVCAFGFSDFFVKKFIKSNINYLLYYILVGIVGVIIISMCKKIEKKEKYNR